MLGFVRAEPSVRFSIARLTITSLNACVGALFLARRVVIRGAPLRTSAIAIPSILTSGVVLKLAGPLSLWPLGASLLFASGGLFAIASLAALGRCFALLPAIRGVVTRGPFRVVRHPAYAGELAMIIACSLASPSPLFAWSAAALAAALLAARIVAEERLLAELPEYRGYAARVRFRLLPGVW